MKINSLFNKDTIFIDNEFASKQQAIEFLSQQLYDKKYVSDVKATYQLFIDRENQGSTGIGEQIAMPHIGSSVVLKNTLMFAKVKDLNWDSLDKQPVNYIFAIALSTDERQNAHLSIMSKLSSLLINSDFKAELTKVSSADEFLRLIDKYEVNLSKDVENVHAKNFDIVAVTACPTGIAHTFMAKEKLYEQAKKMNVSIKVETQGAEGVDNKLTDFEIKQAKGVILAVDREIEKTRFANCDNVLEISTQKAIHQPQQQITKVLNKQGKKLNGVTKSNDNNEAAMTFDGFGKKMWRSLMSGISHMLPFIIFGGIMLAVAFVIDMIIGASQGIDLNSQNFLKSFGFNSAISNIIFKIGKIGLGLAVPVLAAYITYALVGRQGLLPGFIIGAIASGQLSETYAFLKPSIVASGVNDAGTFLGTGSGFVGGIFGAFFAAAMVIVFSQYIFGKLSATMQGIKNILFLPLFGTLAIAILFWGVNIVLIYINLGLVLFLQLFESKPYLAWLLGLILGIMMATDLGGPINKSAYIFGTLSIATGTSTVSMAAVMIAGMVPPLGIALSMFISKKLWSKEDREAGKWSNILFGLSFISEGAIPYTSKNPKVMVPANIVGGAVAGLVSALLGVNIIAPHGGIFVVFLAKTSLIEDNLGLSIGLGVLFFIIALLVGSFASAGTIWLVNFVNKKYPNLSNKFKFKKAKVAK
ncbi:PTS system D-fructose-specific IIA component (F6P-forming, Fru family) /PTS system D-fructose-specific IIB component (F6P-forming, Fru family) /PTS system D-fructose-specific IIC component (F6P-forming, Fru family) [Mycoplasmopsis mustelae]|uniref:PTS system D-fructose-specific IIA component (F6P-forming, Fru family) /PTS system D-fructose-specific IIB component (F6P-forming, Fru family) /PTS system D-fructose-specific IIC component (F6P-for... n=1 Tax=Mycoplasmopsis mustelae TaxID=171289 RepID=A0A4R7UC69_9BACT|nr:fructose-specific PTS transporter subunit EIIC [Mycoplasmopsis mustelae]TDV23541.1 PTS system D-fructose-specific IIA component (F6P-forming, Fru family) /PTS system D-fructose-specific IIB component (F6P-forming, Fru family) /PTS system D-fructose-specific IIC component (F6P-forming, Fru family) [Mycoplasmopsis mustelae]